MSFCFKNKVKQYIEIYKIMDRYYYIFHDAQEDYKDLNDDLDKLLSKYFVYSICSQESE